MKKNIVRWIIFLAALSVVTAFMLVGCGGGGGGVGTPANAAAPNILAAGISKSVYLYKGTNEERFDLTGEVFISGNQISFTIGTGDVIISNMPYKVTARP